VVYARVRLVEQKKIAEKHFFAVAFRRENVHHIRSRNQREAVR
jgi:hypothetical protein